MRLNVTKLSHICSITIIFLAIGIAYGHLLKGFFLQDEWWTFGDIFFTQGEGVIGYLKYNLMALGKVHAIPISAVIPYIEYILFGINFSYYAVVSLMIHFFSSLAVYYLSLLLIRRRFLAVLVALLFAVNGISYPAVTWVAAINTQIVVLFSLLCLIFMFLHVKLKLEKKYLLTSLLFLLLALFSNESAFALFLILPVFWIILAGKIDRKIIRKVISPLFFLGLLYLVVRIPIWILAKPIYLEHAQLLTQPNIIVFLYRLAVLSMRILSQAIISQSALLRISEVVMRLGYPQFIAPDNAANPYLRETIFFDLVNFSIAIALFLLSVYIYFYLKKNKMYAELKAFLIALCLTILSGVMLIFIPGKAGFVALFEPKHLYLVSAGASMFFVLVIYVLALMISKKRKAVTVLMLIFFIPIFLLNAYQIRSNMKELTKTGALRKSFLVRVREQHPDLAKKTVFYLNSNKAYYGMSVEETNLPVQIGFGRMLLVWYQDTENFPTCFYANNYLLELLSQDYLECDGRGFGYYREYDKLVESVEKNEIPIDNVIAYSWVDRGKRFTDITGQIQEKLKNDLKR